MEAMKIQLDNPTALEINEAFAANPELDAVEAYGSEIKRSECEREGLWRVCKDKIDAGSATITRGEELSNHRTFAEARAALSSHFSQQCSRSGPCIRASRSARGSVRDL